MGYTESMRHRAAALLTALLAGLLAIPAARAAAAPALTRSLNLGMTQAGVYSGTEVADLSIGRVIYRHNADVPRLPASVNKLFTTSTLLARFGAGARLATSVLGVGHLAGSTYDGSLYLRGGGDPTFGSAGFDYRAYGTGATVGQLVSGLRRAGIRRLNGAIVGDGSWFDSDRGTPATGNHPSIDVEGDLGGLTFNRGWANATGSAYVSQPAVQAAQQLASALRGAGVALPRHLRVRAGRAPAGATTLARAASPTMATLVGLTNTPSDNFFAETLLKDLGARYGSGGRTAAGAALVRSEMAQSFGIHPYMNDGSGLSRADRTTPEQVVTLLSAQANDAPFANSLAVAGRTGTLVDEMRGTVAQGRCRGKTGTLHDVSNLVGYCTARDGHTLAFAVMMNGVIPDAAHPIQNRMVQAIAGYDG